MKTITNWRQATVADIEADNLLDNATLMHVLSYKLAGKPVKSIDKTDQYERIRKFFQYHIDNKIPIVMHNGISYDAPLVEKILGMDLSELMVIDTLGLSWHLNPDRKSHGLDSFFGDYNIAKPPVDDWVNITYEEAEHRCESDVAINLALWEDLASRLEDMYSRSKEAIDNGLVGGKRVDENEEIYIDRLVGISVDEHIDRLLTFIMFKMDCNRLQEKTRWKVDVPFLEESLAELNGLLETAQTELEGVMPKIPKYVPRKRPAKPYKKNGELSASGEKWEEIRDLIRKDAKDDAGHPLVIGTGDGDVKVLKSYEEPNINSSQQIKDFLFSKGWEPESFKYERDKDAFEQWIQDKPREGSPRMLWTEWKHSRPVDRKIPQISVDGKNGKELCPSVVRLEEEVPEIKAYSKYTTIKHRRDLLKGIQGRMSEDGYVQASMGGLANTFRIYHRAPLANLPGVDKPYGKNVRGCLVAGEGEISMGSDLSSLEDKIKQMFMLPHDPDYVETMMADDYDPHILTANRSGFVTDLEMENHKKGNETEKTKSARKLGKSTNYASQYGSGAATLARAAGISLKDAQKLLDGYWELNHSVIKIAEEQVVITCDKGFNWLINPINGFCYSLRNEKDRFSTLCQGTGSFLFDMWIDNMLESMDKVFGKRKLTAQYHDEHIVIFKNTERNSVLMKEITEKSLENVNQEFMLRIRLTCDTQLGKSYADIH